jgi:hypothetical protein
VQDLAGLRIDQDRPLRLQGGEAVQNARAMDGSSHSICSAVISPSRPNVVEYQEFLHRGMVPAASVDSMRDRLRIGTRSR